MTRSWFPIFLLLVLSLLGCKKAKEAIAAAAAPAAAEAAKVEVKPLMERIDKVGEEMRTIDIRGLQAQQQMEEKLHELKRLAEEAEKDRDTAKKGLEEIEIERQQGQRRIETELKETKLRFAEDAAKELQAQRKKKEQEGAVFSWLRTFLLLLGVITVIKIFAKPLWRVVQTILLRNLAPAPRRIFNVSAK